MAYQTAGAGTDVSGGGVRLNMIPKEGGNRYSGAFFGAWSDGRWQSDNLTQSLRDRGLSVPDKISKIYDFNASFGGPLRADTLWFFTSARRWGVDAPIADSYYTPAGSNYPLCTARTIQCEQGIDDQHIKSAMVRLTWQVSPRNKFGIYYDRVAKDRGHGMNAGDDPATASQIWTSPDYSTGSLKWTSTASSRLLVEGGYSSTASGTTSPTSRGSISSAAPPRGTPAPAGEISTSARTTHRSTPTRVSIRIGTTCRAQRRTSPARTTSRPARNGTGVRIGGRGSPMPI